MTHGVRTNSAYGGDKRGGGGPWRERGADRVTSIITAERKGPQVAPSWEAHEETWRHPWMHYGQFSREHGTSAPNSLWGHTER